MEISSTQRQVIEANALRTSWQQLTPWLLRHQGTASATPAVLVDWLDTAIEDGRLAGGRAALGA